MYARQGESEAALNDAISAASLSPQSREKLQIAGIYAMVGAQHNDPDHRTTALTWLASALREDVSIARIAARDDDLAELRPDQRFGQLIGGARVIDLQSHAKTVATKE